MSANPLTFRPFSVTDWYGWAGATDPAEIADTFAAVFILCPRDSGAAEYHGEINSAFGGVYWVEASNRAAVSALLSAGSAALDALNPHAADYCATEIAALTALGFAVIEEPTPAGRY